MTPEVNPEAIVIAANAAIAAQNMAQFAAFAVGGIFLMMVIVLVAQAWVALKFQELRHQTNSLMEKLLITTASDSEARGDLAGRAALKQEQSARAKVKEKK